MFAKVCGVSPRREGVIAVLLFSSIGILIFVNEITEKFEIPIVPQNPSIARQFLYQKVEGYVVVKELRNSVDEAEKSQWMQKGPLFDLLRDLQRPPHSWNDDVLNDKFEKRCAHLHPLQRLRLVTCRAAWMRSLQAAVLVQLIDIKIDPFGAHHFIVRLEDNSLAVYKPCSIRGYIPENDVIASRIDYFASFNQMLPSMIRNVSVSWLQRLLEVEQPIPLFNLAKERTLQKVAASCAFEDGVFSGAITPYLGNQYDKNPSFFLQRTSTFPTLLPASLESYALDLGKLASTVYYSENETVSEDKKHSIVLETKSKGEKSDPLEKDYLTLLTKAINVLHKERNYHQIQTLLQTHIFFFVMGVTQTAPDFHEFRLITSEKIASADDVPYKGSQYFFEEFWGDDQNEAKTLQEYWNSVQDADENDDPEKSEKRRQQLFLGEDTTGDGSQKQSYRRWDGYLSVGLERSNLWYHDPGLGGRLLLCHLCGDHGKVDHTLHRIRKALQRLISTTKDGTVDFSAKENTLKAKLITTENIRGVLGKLLARSLLGDYSAIQVNKLWCEVLENRIIEMKKCLDWCFENQPIAQLAL